MSQFHGSSLNVTPNKFNSLSHLKNAQFISSGQTKHYRSMSWPLPWFIIIIIMIIIVIVIIVVVVVVEFVFFFYIALAKIRWQLKVEQEWV